MKKYIILLLILTFIGCSNKNNPSLTNLKVYNNATISEDYPFITDGNSLVFHYYFEAEDEENIADDEFAEDFFIEITTSGNAFTLNSDDLKELSHLYRQYCFCGSINYSSITAGLLEGVKKSNEDWSIFGQITLELGYIDEDTQEIFWQHEKELVLSGTFHSANIPIGID